MNDKIKCNKCEWAGVVAGGTETCPQCGRKGYLAWQDPEEPETEEPVTIITAKSDINDTNSEKIDAIKKDLENAGCSAASLIAEHLDALLSFNDDNEEILITAIDLEEVAEWAQSTAQKLRVLVK